MGEAAKVEAEEAIAKASAAKETAEAVSSALADIDSLLGSLLARKRRQDSLLARKERQDSQDSPLRFLLSRKRGKRQETTTTKSISAPTSCSEFTDMVDQVTAALTEGSEDYDPTKALALVEVMKTVTSEDFTCSTEEVNNLKDKVNTAKDAADEVVNTQTAVIAAETEKYEAAIAAIEALTSTSDTSGSGTSGSSTSGSSTSGSGTGGLSTGGSSAGGSNSPTTGESNPSPGTSTSFSEN